MPISTSAFSRTRRGAGVGQPCPSAHGPALVVVKMPANNGAANAIGVARCMDERAVLLDRERARFPGGNRQVR